MTRTKSGRSLSGATVSDTFRICGVVRIVTREEKKKKTPLESWELMRGDAFLPPIAGDELFSRLPWGKTAEVALGRCAGCAPAVIFPAPSPPSRRWAFSTFSGAKWFASAKREVTLIAAGLNLFAMIALLVACIGITNTLVTSVVERTQEIGILRAVGATRTQILGLFLAEGTFIGLAGSLLGLGLARGLAIPADRWVWGMIEKVVGRRQADRKYGLRLPVVAVHRLGGLRGVRDNRGRVLPRSSRGEDSPD